MTGAEHNYFLSMHTKTRASIGIYNGSIRQARRLLRTMAFALAFVMAFAFVDVAPANATVATAPVAPEVAAPPKNASVAVPFNEAAAQEAAAEKHAERAAEAKSEAERLEEEATEKHREQQAAADQHAAAEQAAAERQAAEARQAAQQAAAEVAVATKAEKQAAKQATAERAVAKEAAKAGSAAEADAAARDLMVGPDKEWMCKVKLPSSPHFSSYGLSLASFESPGKLLCERLEFSRQLEAIEAIRATWHSNKSQSSWDPEQQQQNLVKVGSELIKPSVSIFKTARRRLTLLTRSPTCGCT